MYLSLLDGKYGGRIYALMFSFSAVGMDFMAQDLGRQGLSTAQVVFMRMALTLPSLLLVAYFLQPQVFKELNIFHIGLKLPSKLPTHNQERYEARESTLLLPSSGVSVDHDANTDRDAFRARLLWTRGIITAVAIYCIYASFSYADISDSVAITNTRFLPIAFLGWLVLGERVNWRTGGAAAVSFCAVICIVQPSFIFERFSPPTPDASTTKSYFRYLFAIAATLLQAIEYIILRHVGRRARVLSSLIPYVVCATILSLGILGFQGIHVVCLSELKIWARAICLMGISFFPQTCNILALQRETAARVSMVGYMQVVFALLFQVIILGDIPNKLNMGAFAIVVLVGLWHISADNMEEDEDESESGAADFKP